jgi:hypothetical protein
MATWMWALLLKPILLAIFVSLVVAPIAWAFYRLFPDGRLKVFLFRVRDGPHATQRDKWIYTLIGIVLYAALIGWVAVLILRAP